MFAALALPLLEGLDATVKSGIMAADASSNPGATTEPPRKKRRCKTIAAETRADLGAGTPRFTSWPPLAR